MWSELWSSASSSVMSAFSLGSATKGALILVGLGVAAIGLGMILKGTAQVVHEVRDRDVDLSQEEEESDQSEQAETESSEDQSEKSE